jgi:hypothetical protein
MRPYRSGLVADAHVALAVRSKSSHVAWVDMAAGPGAYMRLDKVAYIESERELSYRKINRQNGGG